jgi:hypothetical protein
MQTVIASTTLTAVPARGESFEVTIEVYLPYLEDGVWRCAASVRPLWERLAPAFGEDSFQAMCLAIALVRSLLEHFQEEGGSLLMVGKPWPFEAYPMGVLRPA